jgi:CO/xanthine dehydrogenase FAD-binding subunit
MVALDASFKLQRKAGERNLGAEEFFVSQLVTALEPDELLVEVELPPWPERTGSSLQEVAVRLGDFALGGVASVLSLDDVGDISGASIVPFGVGERPVRVREAEQVLLGSRPGEAAFAEAGTIVSQRVEPWGDIHASAAYRKRLAGHLTQRALAASFEAAHA